MLNPRSIPSTLLLPGLACEVLSILAIVGAFALLRLYWWQIPHRVAVHFSLTGRPDRWGPKRLLTWIPVTIACMYLILAVMPFPLGWLILPSVHPNGPADGPAFLKWALLSLLRAALTWCLLYLEWRTIQVAIGKAAGIGWAVLIVAIAFGALYPLVVLVLLHPS